MVFIVEFADGTKHQIRAGVVTEARSLAVARFKDKLVLAVRPAGLFEMGYRAQPDKAPKVFN